MREALITSEVVLCASKYRAGRVGAGGGGNIWHRIINGVYRASFCPIMARRTGSAAANESPW